MALIKKFFWILLFSGIAILVLSVFGGQFQWLARLDKHFTYGLFYMALLNKVIYHPGFLSELFSMRILRFFGRLSFGLYLTHQPIAGLLHGAAFSTEPHLGSPEQIAITLLSLLICVTISYGLYIFLEQPFIQWGYRQTDGLNRLAHFEAHSDHSPHHKYSPSWN